MTLSQPLEQFKLRDLGMQIEEAYLTSWYVGEGDVVTQGQVIAEVETDKAVVQLDCPFPGIVRRIVVLPDPDNPVRVGQLLAEIEPSTAGTR